MSRVWEGRPRTPTVPLLRPSSWRPTPCRPRQGPPPRGTLPPLSPTGHRGGCWHLGRAGRGHHSERARGRLQPAPCGDVLLDPRGREYPQRGLLRLAWPHGPLLAGQEGTAGAPLPSDAGQEGTAGAPLRGLSPPVSSFSLLSVFPRRHCQSRDSRVSQQMPGRWDPGCGGVGGRGGRVQGGAVLGGGAQLRLVLCLSGSDLQPRCGCGTGAGQVSAAGGAVPPCGQSGAHVETPGRRPARP